ncbi:MAG TPA: decaprenyl-phosphate phosphoribosyltransferase [Armatimonadota bacterium]|jgi:4-hydroxybenzoate polyprenyltransferase
MRKLVGWIRALRPQQWTKNGLVFAALIFAHQFRDSAQVERAVAAFVLFCALASSVYLVNDLCDLEEDRRHPKKCRRPLAAGLISPLTGVITAVLLGVGGLAGFFLLNAASGWIAVTYLVLQLAYNLRLKQVVIVDVLCVSAGFVIRAAIGATAINVVISPWLLICTILLALFLALSKRRQELQTHGAEAANHRRILEEYSPYLLDQMIAVVTASTLMSYALYTISDRTVRELGTDKLMYTIPFVIYGIFRYLYLVHKKDEGEAPDRVLLTDAPLLIDALLYGVAVVVILIFFARPGGPFAF